MKEAQLRELNRTQEQIDERKRRILRSQISGRGSLLSGSERGIRQGEQRLVRNPPAQPGIGPPSRPPPNRRRFSGIVGGLLQRVGAA